MLFIISSITISIEGENNLVGNGNKVEFSSSLAFPLGEGFDDNCWTQRRETEERRKKEAFVGWVVVGGLYLAFWPLV